MGVDPGAKGALALIDTEAWTLALTDMPTEVVSKGGKLATSPQGMARLIGLTAPDAVFVEEVHAMPGQGTVSMFSFGRAYGIVLGAACGSGCMLWPTPPQVWKTATKTPKDKAMAVTRAQQLFPCAYADFVGPRGGKKDGRAEAALLALYGCLKLQHAPARPFTLAEFPS